ncbi:fimbria/pilus periplasmic chaperone [Serratia marcescens]|uniref:fimbria/pilus periplasmic chaperone n=1 Tax=Serratia marcescens TaxID=615 RepID=UPI002238866D|nr:fimbria/pilus periplasmic chaperone [Serratia marcescens]MCW6016415.1 fimbria/pilus periplasmic chaperone [Serratia marcescens]MCW6025660.1 fimbria/pilus periplasmic chaperone [Serratia marcescens]
MKMLSNTVRASTLLGVALFQFHAMAAGLPGSVTKYETILGANRIIYSSSANGASLSVTNPQDFPILIQSMVLNEALKPVDTFVVTPPVFRLDGKRMNKLSIVLAEDNGVSDRESLNWLCVKSIPPKSDDVWAKEENNAQSKKQADVNLQLSLNNCIKLITRPTSLAGSVESSASTLVWQQRDHELTVTNPSPFYMNLATLMLDGKPVSNNKYVAPYSSQHIPLPSGMGKARNVSWQIVNDFGGNSQTYTKGLK